MAAAIVTIVSVAGTLAGKVILSAQASQSGQCPGTWTIEPSPNLQGGSNVLADVAAISPTEAMGVGWLERRPGNLYPLVERWDGTRWSLAPSADVGGGRVPPFLGCGRREGAFLPP